MNTASVSRLVSVVFLMSWPLVSYAKELHVATGGNDANSGTKAAPFRTIQRAADLAQPGDVITVHGGVYRERINPPRGGESEAKPIAYQAAQGERVEIKGSEVITNWVRVQDQVWQATLPNSFFGRFNPYSDSIHGDWFDPRGRAHHTGAVYLNGDWLIEASQLDHVLNPAAGQPELAIAREQHSALWFAQVDDQNTRIWAHFNGVNPNEQRVEVNVRQTVFYPEKANLNYITVRGFALRHAATPWAPPTAEQIGLIGTHWSKGWVIENNVVSHSTCSGIALGKYGDEYDNTSANSAEGYVKTIERALENGWNRETIGHHIVRNNTISHCEQAGIVGSLGAAFSTVSGNTIHDIHVRRLFSGAEMAGIKFHGAIDSVLRDNHIYRTCLGVWLDWMAQGTRVTSNLLHDNEGQDLFVEVDHGPFVVDNNLFLSGTSLLDVSEGGAYVHNLFLGKIVTSPEPNRQTPFHPAHATTVAGLATIKGGDDRFFNNILVGPGISTNSPSQQVRKDPSWAGGYGLWVYNLREFPLQTGGNVYYRGAQPYAREVDALEHPAFDPEVKLVDADGRYTLQMNLSPEFQSATTTLITTASLGRAKIPGLAYQNADGSPLTVQTDFFGKERNRQHPTPGPFDFAGTGPVTFGLR